MSQPTRARAQKKARLTPEDYCKAILNANGLLTVAAGMLGVHHSAVCKAASRHPKVKEAIKEARERRLDRCELCLDKAIAEGNIQAISLYLLTMGKDRGYVKRQEVTGAGGAPISLVWEDPSDPSGTPE